jgi:hypothetical protein
MREKWYREGVLGDTRIGGAQHEKPEQIAYRNQAIFLPIFNLFWKLSLDGAVSAADFSSSEAPGREIFEISSSG